MSETRSTKQAGSSARRSTKARSASKPPSGTGEARERFARTFADVLSGRFGGRWSVEWEGADRAALPTDRNGRSVTGKE